ncbi:MAG: HlyD family efflux transporter periplasmic adaptor subunit [Ruminococcaceae bacterium]|nr:HlyD family efflux transporter periplasmic adaptor subunit [Oscillospiraceae bacterium]
MEEQVKKRGWIKNAAIIFLSVMLVLTFFSNTIMNRSLPEAATYCVMPGTIETKVRGTGTVEAKENYDVLIEQTRKVVSVPVRVGQEVSVGDVLFTLEPGDSEELKTAEDKLKDLKMEYERMLINATDTDYALENRDIELARNALQKSQTKRDGLVVTKEQLDKAAADVAAAEKVLEDFKTKHTSLSRELEDAEYGLSHSSDGSGYISGGASESMLNAVDEAKNTLKAAQNALKAAQLAHGSAYSTLEEAAKTKIGQDAEGNSQDLVYNNLLPYYMEMLASGLDAKTGKNEAEKAQLAAYKSITAAKNAVAAAQAELDDAQAAVDDANANISYEGGTTYKGKTHAYYQTECARLAPLVADAQEMVDDAQKELDTYEKTNDELKQRNDDYEAAQQDVETKKCALEDLVFALEQQRKADGKAQSLEALDRQALLDDISDAEEELAALQGDAETGKLEVKSMVNGTVKTLNVSAGRKAAAGETLATIEVPDLGYTMSFSVTSEQARKVRVGDTASTSNYYWGSQIDAVLTSIKTDPQSPQTSKLLTFDVTGDVSAGASVTLAVGQKSAQYDFVVPNSAIRSDNNGSFVFVITVKNSPLGNRYTATRVDVQVLASDDLNSAISGALNQNDFVLTTSSKPVANGDLVRLPDNI